MGNAASPIIPLPALDDRQKKRARDENPGPSLDLLDSKVFYWYTGTVNSWYRMGPMCSRLTLYADTIAGL